MDTTSEIKTGIHRYADWRDWRRGTLGKNCSLYDALQALYTRYGWYGERTEQFYRTGQAGAKEIADFMTHLREAPPKQILGTRVVAVRDYLSDDQQSKERKRSAPAQASNVLRLVLQDGAELVVRPSGTEPKNQILYSGLRRYP